MGKKRYNHDDETNEEDFEGSGRLSGQDSLFDRRGDHDEDEEFDEGEDLIDVEELIEEKKSEAYNDDFDVDKAKEQKKKKRIATVKPKLIGKHSLAYDTIFKGKKTDDSIPLETEHIIPGIGGGFDLNEDSSEFNESRHNMDHQTNIKIQQEVYNVLKDNSDINFTANRREPSVSDFNSYFKILITQLAQYGFGKCEIFIELSSYFSDNTYSIFLLLKSEYKNMIIAELKEKYGLSDMDKIDFLT
jgi:hypothetical protein